MTRLKRTRPLSTSLKTFQVLETIAEWKTSVSLAELAQRLNLPRAYVYQQLVTLMTAGWVEQVEDREYRLTLRATQIAQAALEQAGLDQRALPLMEKLAREIQETVSLAVLVNGMAQIAQRVEVGQPLRAELGVGTRMPIFHSASGRVLAAFAEPHQLAELVREGIELPSEAELEEVRKRGYAFSTGQWLEGIRSIAAPVYALGGRCIAALSIVCPTSRFDPEKFRDPLLAHAKAISLIFQGEEGSS